MPLCQHLWKTTSIPSRASHTLFELFAACPDPYSCRCATFQGNDARQRPPSLSLSQLWTQCSAFSMFNSMRDFWTIVHLCHCHADKLLRRCGLICHGAALAVAVAISSLKFCTEQVANLTLVELRFARLITVRRML